MPEWRPWLRDRFAAAGHEPDEDVIQELSAHAELAYESARADGCDSGDARQRVERLADEWIANARELRRRPRRPPAVEPPNAHRSLVAGLAQDVRYGFRQLRRQPAFTALAVLTMALGLGATTALWSVVDGVLLKPLPWANADRLVRVSETRGGREARVRGAILNGTFVAWADHPKTVEGLAGWMRQTRTLTSQGRDASRIDVVSVTPSAFPMLGARPLLGRLFEVDEGKRGSPAVALASYALWHEQLGGGPDALGRMVQLDGAPYTIVGVMPRGFVFPDRDARLWTAWQVPGTAGADGSQVGVIFSAMARLRPDVSLAQAAAEGTSRGLGAPDASVVALSLFGAKGPIDVHVTPMRDALTADVRPAVLLLFVAVALLLVTAIANIASLQLARATARRRELAVRASLGAGLPRLVRQLLVENVMLGVAGGAAGLGLAAGLMRVLPSVLPPDFPRVEAVAIDMRVLAFAAAASLVAGVVCGLAPAWHVRRLNLVETLAEDGAAPIGGSLRLSAARTRASIMTGQVAVSCVLLVGAALLARSFIALARADRGFDPVNVLTARLPFPSGFPGERRVQLTDALAARIRAVPGVTSVAYSNTLPFASSGRFAAFVMRSPKRPDVELNVQTAQHIVSPEFFQTMRLRLVDGRLLSPLDVSVSPPPVVVNRTFAARYLDDHAVGMRIPQQGPRSGIRLGDGQGEWQVAGVVEDMRQDRVDAEEQPGIFALFAQVSSGSLAGLSPFLIVRTHDAPASHVQTLRAILHDEAPALAFDSVMTLEDRMAASLASPRLYAVVIAGLALFALVIAAVGLFSVLSYTVALRTREIGVRSALGAQRRDIVWLVARDAAVIAIAGIGVGLLIAFAASRGLSAFLFGVAPHDAATFAAVSVVLVVVTLLASIGPAIRAASLQPMSAVRGSTQSAPLHRIRRRSSR